MKLVSAYGLNVGHLGDEHIGRTSTFALRFPAPIVTAGPHRAWSRDDMEAWMDNERWWDSKP